MGEVHGQRVTVTVFDRELGPPLPPPIRDRHAGTGSSDGSIVAPIPGNVLHVHVEAGQRVHAGQVVCVLEAMKMENEIAAPADGQVESVAVHAGDAVAAGTLLVSIAVDQPD
jgi:biotin carboxyl carrier protein